jgi:hypothetical protein
LAHEVERPPCFSKILSSTLIVIRHGRGRTVPVINLLASGRAEAVEGSRRREAFAAHRTALEVPGGCGTGAAVTIPAVPLDEFTGLANPLGVGAVKAMAAGAAGLPSKVIRR